MFDLSRISLLTQTIFYLKRKQIDYRLRYIFRNKWRKINNFKYLLALKSNPHVINLSPTIPSNVSYRKNTFIFLFHFL